MNRKLTALLVTLGIFGTAAIASADVRHDRRERPAQIRDHRGPSQPAVAYRPWARPQWAPPATRTEVVRHRPGYVWVNGNYVWRGGAYRWAPGHWERQQIGREWVPGHWTLTRGGYVWIAGTWRPVIRPFARFSLTLR